MESRVQQIYATLQTFVCSFCFIIGSNAQLVGQQVKDSNKNTMLVKYDYFSSIIAYCRSATAFKYEFDSKYEFDLKRQTETREFKEN